MINLLMEKKNTIRALEENIKEYGKVKDIIDYIDTSDSIYNTYCDLVGLYNGVPALKVKIESSVEELLKNKNIISYDNGIVFINNLDAFVSEIRNCADLEYKGSEISIYKEPIPLEAYKVFKGAIERDLLKIKKIEDKICKQVQFDTIKTFKDRGYTLATDIELSGYNIMVVGSNNTSSVAILKDWDNNIDMLFNYFNLIYVIGNVGKHNNYGVLLYKNGKLIIEKEANYVYQPKQITEYITNKINNKNFDCMLSFLKT